MRITETKLRRIIRKTLITEHLHGWEGSYWAPYMERELPPEASSMPHFGEWKEEFDHTKEAIEDNYRKMTALSIDYPKMDTSRVDENEMNLAEFFY